MPWCQCNLSLRYNKRLRDEKCPDIVRALLSVMTRKRIPSSSTCIVYIRARSLFHRLKTGVEISFSQRGRGPCDTVGLVTPCRHGRRLKMVAVSLPPSRKNFFLSEFGRKQARHAVRRRAPARHKDGIMRRTDGSPPQEIAVVGPTLGAAFGSAVVLLL